MANAYLNMAATTTAEKVVRRAKAFCQLPTGQSNGINFLGSTDATVLDELADCVNDAVRDVLNDCPILCLSEATLTTSAGVAYTALPTDLDGASIMDLKWAGDDMYAGRGIRMISHQERDRLPHTQLYSDYQQDPPDFCYFGLGDAAARLYWYPVPASDREFTILYRIKPTPVTSADVGVEGSAVSPAVVPVPDDMIEMLACKVATKLAFRNNGSDGTTWQVIEAKYQLMLTEWAGRIASSPYAQRMAQITFEGLPGRSVAATQRYEVSR